MQASSIDMEEGSVKQENKEKNVAGAAEFTDQDEKYKGKNYQCHQPPLISQHQYPSTMQGLRLWVEAYARKYPVYRLMTTNCQHFSTVLFNAVTGSKKKEKQWYSHALPPTYTAMKKTQGDNDFPSSLVAEGL